MLGPSCFTNTRRAVGSQVGSGQLGGVASPSPGDYSPPGPAFVSVSVTAASQPMSSHCPASSRMWASSSAATASSGGISAWMLMVIELGSAIGVALLFDVLRYQVPQGVSGLLPAFAAHV